MGGRGFASARSEKFNTRAERQKRSEARQTARTVGGGDTFTRSGQSDAQLRAADKANTAATAAWFNGLTNEQKQAIRVYTGNEHQNINKLLRNDKNLSGYYKAMVERVSSSFNSASALNKGMVVYRGATVSETSKTGKAMLTKGAEFTDKGFTSTSISRSVGKDFLYENGNTLLRIEIPKGVRVGYLGNSGGRSQNATEHEVLLNKGTRYRVKNVRRNQYVTDNLTGERLRINIVTLRVI